MRKISPMLSVIIVLMLCTSLISCGKKEKEISKGHTEEERIAQEIASHWLELVDSENYGEAWDKAAGYLKSAVTKEEFQSSLSGVRKPLGKLISRIVKSKKYCKSLPGAPDGEYVVMEYETSFEKKKSAIETVSPMKDKDGKWRVSGYYIK
ncbi:DUF4019 domain-containing protein [candidate division WOR-3 bacterium]|nr:DUF4019 domain-containing protein [candidate division WOR-3 bacterium]